MQQLIDHPSDVAQHISCATVNMAEERIIKHPSHPEHFLSFFKYKSQFTCDDCGEEGVGNGYECAVCNFELHMSCAMNNTTEKKVIQHPIDPGHCLSYVRYPHGFTCNECGQKGCGKGYGCVACDFDLHKSCATIEMAEERAIMHPLHPAHCLSFFKYKRGFICNACGEEGRGNSYGCAVCKFDLHISCATATDTDTDTDTETPLSCLGHRLSYARYTTAFTCNLCGEGGRKNGYGCVACDFDLHISCATLNMAGQRPIQHPSHPRHRLSYVRYPRGFFFATVADRICMATGIDALFVILICIYAAPSLLQMTTESPSQLPDNQRKVVVTTKETTQLLEALLLTWLYVTGIDMIKWEFLKDIKYKVKDLMIYKTTF